jgi:hypothetical protein
MVRAKLEGVVPSDATVATSPLTLPLPELVGKVAMVEGVKVNVGVMENPSNAGVVQQSEKIAELETCMFKTNAMLLPVTVSGAGSFTVGP